MKLQSTGTKSLKLMIERVTIYKNHIDAIQPSSIIAVLTEWDEFKDYDWKNLLLDKKLFDGRNIIPEAYYSIGN